jgi:hypothetical protein
VVYVMNVFRCPVRRLIVSTFDLKATALAPLFFTACQHDLLFGHIGLAARINPLG